jgi:hypothetical protein
MQNERPEFTETKRARWKAWLCGGLALAAPVLLQGSEAAWMAPYAFAFFLVIAACLGISVETDRLHRRVDAIRDGD